MATIETFDEIYRVAEISELREHPRNPRQGDVGAIVTSIEANGFYGALEVQKSTGYVLVGNHRLKALRALGRKHVPIIEKDVDDETALRILLVDNRTADLASYDEAVLLALLVEAAEADNLLGTGYDPDDLDEMLQAAAADAGAFGTRDDDDNVPELRAGRPRSKPGQLYQLGPHRLVCGDATDPETAKLLMGDEHGSLLFTSPPYLDVREYDTAATAPDDLAPDHLARFLGVYAERADLLGVTLGLIRREHEIQTYWDAYNQAAREAGLKLLAWNVWDKGEAGTMGQATAMFPTHHEFVFVYGERTTKLRKTIRNKTPGTGKTGNNIRNADGNTTPKESRPHGERRSHGSVFHAPPHKGTNVHPAVFPVALPLAYIEAATRLGDVIIDPFAGAGATMIAAARSHRRCYMVEISPRYCDVIRDRWEQLEEEGETTTDVTIEPAA